MFYYTAEVTRIPAGRGITIQLWQRNSVPVRSKQHSLYIIYNNIMSSIHASLTVVSLCSITYIQTVDVSTIRVSWMHAPSAACSQSELTVTVRSGMNTCSYSVLFPSLHHFVSH